MQGICEFEYKNNVWVVTIIETDERFEFEHGMVALTSQPGESLRGYVCTLQGINTLDMSTTAARTLRVGSPRLTGFGYATRMELLPNGRKRRAIRVRKGA